MRIRNRKTYFTTMPEGNAPETRTKKLSAILYFCILGFIVLYILYYVGARYFSFERNGQVQVKRHLILSETDGTIESVYAGIGDRVERSMLILKIRPASPIEGRNENSYSFQDKNRAVLDKLLRLENDIRMAEIDVMEAKEGLRLLKQQKKNLQQVNYQDRLLELSYQPKDMSRLENDIEKASLKLKKQKAVKHALEQFRLSVLENYRPLRSDNYNDNQAEGLSYETILETLKAKRVPGMADGLIYAPVNGFVDKLFKNPGAQVFAGDPIMTLRPETEDVMIHGFFKQSQVRYIKKGKKVKISFPDKSESTGLIDQYYAFSESYKEKLKDGYTPLKSGILVEIRPVGPGDSPLWRKYDRMNVILRIRK